MLDLYKTFVKKICSYDENKVLFLLLFFLLTISFIGQLSVSNGHFSTNISNHFMRMLLGILSMLVVSLINFKFWLNFAYVFYLFTFIALFVVHLLGTLKLGAQRWIDLYFFTFQPSELMKLTLIISLARYYSILSNYEFQDVKKHIIPLLMVVLPSLLILKQPDLGTASVLFFVGIGMIFLANFPAKIFCISTLSCVAICPLGWFLLKDYQKNRILTFINPDSDPLGMGYHIFQSKIAIGSGGLAGKGFLCGTQSKLNFLPEKNTDFIFTTITEELGFLGGCAIIVLLSTLTLYCFWIGTSLKHMFAKLVCYGLGLLLFFHSFTNIAMVMGIVPVVGIPLPFISYGGSSMVTFMISCGLVISASTSKKG